MSDEGATTDAAINDDFIDGAGALEGKTPSGRRARRWAPEAEVEVAAVLRLLMVRPWLVAGRDDESLAKVKVHADVLRGVFARLGWVLVVERDLARLRKSPPVRRAAYALAAPSARTFQWFFLLVAAAESMGRHVALGPLVTAARAAAAEAGVPTTGDIVERRAIVAALKMLTERGALSKLDGEMDGYVHDDNPPVLLEVHHTRLLHVIANFSGDHDPAADPAGWLAAVEREPDPSRRMRRRLVDDTIVHVADLDDAEADWMSRRVRSDDGKPLAEMFGLHLERRAEGAAFVVPESVFRHPHELGPLPFPASGTVGHAALLVCIWAAEAGVSVGDAAGWRRVADSEVALKLVELAAAHPPGTGGWKADMVADPTGKLSDSVAALLVGLDLARIDETAWVFSPAIHRWPPPKTKTQRPKPRPKTAETQASFEFGEF